MSTEQQLISPEVQRKAISDYAVAHRMVVTTSYFDEGKSGLTIEGRPALRQLLADVTGGKAEYSAVLVYDVSRWGRFQDVDESAHYEYLCRRCGVQVIYCAEPFASDLSPITSVMKSLKRVMAGEYSRELSEKIYRSKCRQAAKGIRQGAMAGYGYRRMVAGAPGLAPIMLARGQYKRLRGDRVVLVPGPPEECAIVRWIFERVACHGDRPRAIADRLNDRGIVGPNNKRWHSSSISRMLLDEKYAGVLVFNRTSTKLKTPRVRRALHEWIRVPGNHPALISLDLFERAQRVMSQWSTRVTNEQALAQLKALLDRLGALSGPLIDKAGGMPKADFYAGRFGSLCEAYRRIGYEPARTRAFVNSYGRHRARAREFRLQVDGMLRDRGVEHEWLSGQIVAVGERTIAVLSSFGRAHPTKGWVWLAELHMQPVPDWALLERMHEDASGPKDYWLAPVVSQAMYVGIRHRTRRDRRQSMTVEPLIEMIVEGLPPVTDLPERHAMMGRQPKRLRESSSREQRSLRSSRKA